MLVEREKEISQLDKAAERTFAGRGGIVLLSGEAGIGKTVLLEDFRLRLKRGEAHKLFWSGCDPLLTPRPLGPLHDVATRISTDVLELLEAGAPPASIFAALYDDLEQIQQPVVLVFEDVHWADNATLDLFKYLGRRVSFLQCLLIISFRDDEIDQQHALNTVIDVLPSAHTTRISIKPLSEQGVEQLAKNVDRDSGDLYEITAGNPFFVTELLASDENSQTSLPASIRDAINSRLSRLTPPERNFLETISLIPNAVSQDLVETLCGQIGEICAQACVARSLLQINEDNSVRFRHELARLATLARVPINQLKRMHGEILDALEKCKNENLGSLVHHAAGALDGKRVLKYAPQAATRAAALGAHREAVAYLATALRFVDEADTQLAAQLYEDWAYEQGLALPITDEVIEARRHAISLWRALDRKDKIGENLRWLSRLHWYRGESAEANHFGGEAIKVFESIPASSERAMAYSIRAQLDMLNDRMDDAFKWGKQALAVEEEFPNAEVRVHALNNIGSALAMRGDEEGLRYLQESLKLALANGFHEHAARAYTNMADVCLRYKKLEQAETVIENGIAHDTQFDLDSWTYYLVGFQAQLRMEQGRLRDAETIALGVLDLQSLTVLMRIPALIVRARSQTRLLNPAAQKNLKNVLQTAFDFDEVQYIVPARLCAIEFAWLNNDPYLAKEQLELLIEMQASSLDHWSSAEIAVWIKRFGFNLSYLPLDEVPKPHALELGGDCVQAADQWLSLGMPYNAALSLIQDDSSSEIKSLPRAYKILETIEAKAGLTLIRKKAKAKGILSKLPRTKRGPYKATRRHPVGLTGREQVVLAFIIEGASNSEIASDLSRSKRTIENHVSSILTKLNVNNRLEAMLRIQNEPWLAPAQPSD